jgi:hypothetical protein
MLFDTRENGYLTCIQDHDGSMGLLDVIDHKEYENEGVHYYIRIRRSNGTIGLYETDALYTWVIDNNGTDPLTRENIWYQKSRLIAKKLWRTLYCDMKTSDITVEFKQQCLTDYLNNTGDENITQKARAFVDIATFESSGFIHQNMSFSETTKYTESRPGWLLRMSSVHGTNVLNTNTRVVVFASRGFQQRFQETDGMGYIILGGSAIGDPMGYTNNVNVSLIDLIEYGCTRQLLKVHDIIKPA